MQIQEELQVLDLLTKKKTKTDINTEQNQRNSILEQLYQEIQKPIKVIILFYNSPNLQNNDDTEYIKECDVIKQIQRWNTQGFQYLVEKNNVESIRILRKSFSCINEYLSYNGKLDLWIIMNCLLNLGINFNQINFIEEAIECFNKAIQIIQQKSQFCQLNRFSSSQEDYLKKLTFKIKLNKLKSQLHCQSCLLKSELCNHIEALEHSKLAVKFSVKVIILSLHACYISIIQIENPPSKNFLNSIQFEQKLLTNSLKLTQSQNSNFFDQKCIIKSFNQDFTKTKENYLQILVLFEDIYQKLLNLDNYFLSDQKKITIEILQKKVSHINRFKPTSETIYSDYQKNSFKDKLIVDIIALKPCNLPTNSTIFNENTPNEIILNITSLVLSLFCTSVEYRKLEYLQYKEQTIFQYSKAEEMLTKSVELAYTYLQHDFKYVQQIFNSYQLHYNNIQSSINEYDKNQEFQTNFLIPLKGIKKDSKFVPLIRYKTNKLSQLNINNLKESRNLNIRKTISIYNYRNHQQNQKLLNHSQKFYKKYSDKNEQFFQNNHSFNRE